MNQVMTAICLSVSLLAVGLAIFLGQATPDLDGTASDRRWEELATRLDAIQDRLTALEEREARETSIAARDGKRPSLKHPPGGSSTSAKGHEGDAAAPGETVQTIEDRLMALENPETIARLARTGNHQMRSRKTREALAGVFEPGLAPDEQKQRLHAFWKNGGWDLRDMIEDNGIDSEEVTLPLLAIAQDPNMDIETRSKVLAQLADNMHYGELREPTIQMVWNEQEPALRQQAVRNLANVVGRDLKLPEALPDPAAQNALIAAATEDGDPTVRGTASRRVARMFEHARDIAPESPLARLSDSQVDAIRKEGQIPGDDSFSIQISPDGRRGVQIIKFNGQEAEVQVQPVDEGER